MTRAEVLGQARRYAAADSLQCSIDATTSGPRSDADLITDYLADANPYPDRTAVEVLDRVTESWQPAVIVDRAWPNEWQVDFDDSALGRERADHTEIRYPAGPRDGGPGPGGGATFPRGRRSR